MTDKDTTPMAEDNKPESNIANNKAINQEEIVQPEKVTKPPIGKGAVVVQEATPLITPPPQPAPLPVATDKRNRPETVSVGREALLQVDSYQEAEYLLSEHPDLIDQARTVFGSIVPTSGQNYFMDLAIQAAAEDDTLDLRTALQTKRTQNLHLTTPEIKQVLEFAGEHVHKSPVLALYIALLLTDDLSRIEDTPLWQKQRELVLTAEKSLKVDAMAIWDEISREEGHIPAPDPTPEPEPEPFPVEVKAELEAPKREKPAPPPPPMPALRPKKGQVPPRWVLASGFVGAMSLLSCSACFMGLMF